NILFLLPLFLFSFSLSAQEDSTPPPPDGWNNEGKIQLLFNQTAFNEEWTGGGTSSIAGNLSLDYSFNYRSGSSTWDNKLLANYGLTKLEDDEFTRKTSDRLEFNSIAGKQIENSEWYYSFFGNFRTQFSKGYEYSEGAATGEVIRTETT